MGRSELPNGPRFYGRFPFTISTLFPFFRLVQTGLKEWGPRQGRPKPTRKSSGQHKSEGRNPSSDPLRRRDSAARRSPKPEIRRTNRLPSRSAFRASDFGFLSVFGLRVSGFIPRELEKSSEQSWGRCAARVAGRAYFNFGKNSAAVRQVPALNSSREQPLTWATVSEISKKDAQRIADNIRKAVKKESVELRRIKTHIAVSIGVATFPEDAKVQEELIMKADERLYKAKREGRNRIIAE